jgi:hypothetical protein
MKVQVKLKDIIEGMDFQSDEQSSFLNLTTGEVVAITDEELRAAENDEPLEDFPDWQHDAIRIARDIVETEHYLPWLILDSRGVMGQIWRNRLFLQAFPGGRDRCDILGKSRLISST